MLSVVRDTAAATLPFLFILPLVVTIHELGHFLAAKAFGVKIDRFSINFGAALVKWRDRSGVEWRIGWLPLGGYVRFAADENASSVPDKASLEEMRAEIVRREGPGAERNYFHFKPLWQRAIISAAGPVANFLLAILLFSTLAFAFGEWRVPPRIMTVAQGSAAEAAGFRPGDVVTAMDGEGVDSFTDIGRTVLLSSGDPIRFDLMRDGRPLTLTATPRRAVVVDPVGNQMQMGQLGVGTAARPVHVGFGPVEAIGVGTSRTWGVLSTTLTYLGRVFTGRESAQAISGPLGIGNTARQVAEYGGEGGSSFVLRLGGAAVALLTLAAAISVGLGFMNLLPVPILDGGHLAFYAYEAIARRPLAAAAQGLAYRVGLALILGLMLFATWNDLQRLRVFQVLGGVFS